MPSRVGQSTPCASATLSGGATRWREAGRRRRARRGGGEEPRKPRRKLGRGGGGGETARRILVAVPAIAFAIAITIAGGIVFMVAMIAVGVLCLREYLDTRLA